MFRLNQPLLEDDNGANIAGANTGEAADLQTNNNQSDDTGTGASDDNSVVATQNVQSDDDNAKYAAARREGENKAKLAEDKRKRDIDIAKKYGKEYDVFCEEDIAEKYGDNGIKTLEELEAAILKETYKEAGIDPDLINQAINNHPAIKKAAEIVNQTEESKRQTQIKSDIDSLHKEFPGVFDNIKSEDDIYKDPKWSEIMPLVTQRGYDLADAFHKAYKNDISEKLTKAAAQRQLNNINGKNHLRPDGNSSDIDDFVVDEAELKIAKQLNPNMTREEWVKFKKSQKE